MTLAPLRLDDLSWADLVDAVRSRIPAESAGRWTLHAPVDPGMTLLDLQAYLLEQRIYRLDQVPDAVVHAVLRLLGVPGPAPATAAVTVLQVVPEEPGARLRIREGASFGREPGRGTDFHLDRDLDVLPVRVSGLSVRDASGERDRTADLATGRPVPLAGAPGGPTRVRVRLSVSGDGFPDGGTLALLLTLEEPAGPWTGSPAPEGWSARAVPDVPPPARLRWSYGPVGNVRALPAGAVVDGTGGLRRSGLVRLTLPATAGGTERELLLDTPAATFAAPPRLLGLAPNTVPAHHARRVRLEEGPDGPVARGFVDRPRLPGLVVALPEDAAGRLIDVGRFTLWETDDAGDAGDAGDARAHDWTAVPDLAFSGPLDRVFTVDRAFGALRFGDGLTGRIPRVGRTGSAPVLWAEYRLGGGPSGNGGADLAVRAALPAALLAFPALAGFAGPRPVAGAQSPPGDWVFTGAPEDTEPPGAPCTARALVPSAGGAEPESPAAARRRAAVALGVVTRAVTAADHEELALSTPGVAVARAHALVGVHPAHPGRRVPGAVTTLVVPRVPRAPGDVAAPDAVPLPVPDPGALSAVRARLEAARLLGAGVFVAPPRYRPVRVRVTLAADTARRHLLDAALRRHLDPLVGGDGTGWPFGGVLRPSALQRTAERALEAAGDRTPVRAVAVALDEGPYESCGDVPLRPGELPGPVEVLVCATPPSGAVPREVRT